MKFPSVRASHLTLKTELEGFSFCFHNSSLSQRMACTHHKNPAGVKS